VRDPARPLVLLDPTERAHDHRLDGAAGLEDGILGHVTDADTAAKDPGAAIGLLDPRQDPEERGLPGAVGADKADLIAVDETERQAVEQSPGAVGLSDLLAAEEEWPGYIGYGSVAPSSMPALMPVAANGPVSGRAARRSSARACR
jgi:hypothetical protein